MKVHLLLEALNLNFGYSIDNILWDKPLSIDIRSNERIRILGNNGSGKSTLIKLLIGELSPSVGEVKMADFSYIYLDQQYNQVNKDKTILELVEDYNINNLQDHEIKLRLTRALFPKDFWDKNCQTLSEGERMR